MSSTPGVQSGRVHTMRLRHRLTVAVGVMALAGATVAVAVPASAHPTGWNASAAAAHHAKQPATVGGFTGSVHYAVNKLTCAVPKNPDAPRCFAMKRVNVSKGTPHAYRYVVPNKFSRGPANGYTPADLASAYGYNPKSNRTSQLVGIVDWFDDPYALKDLNAFDHHYGLKKETARSFRKVNQAGQAKPLPKPNKDSSGEIALDVESVRAVCNTCRILLIEAKTGTDKNLATAENLAVTMGATEISNSFGETEHKVPAYVRKAYNHPGVVITASTGDDGWYAWDGINNNGKPANAAEYPSSDPDVVAVGGTALGINKSGRYAEQVWNENGYEDQTANNNEGAGGGGCSKLYKAAPWQSHYPGYKAAGCNGERLASDISAIADPAYGFDILDSYTGGWGTVGGTSLASPVVAAMYALAGGAAGQAYPAASLYVNAAERPKSLFDVIVGGNGFCGGDTTQNCGNAVYSEFGTHNPNGLVYQSNHKRVGNLDCSFPRNGADSGSPPALSSECNAVTGYDGPTGLGTPNSDLLFGPTNAKLSVGHGAATVKKSVVLNAHIKQRVSGTRETRLLWNFGDSKTATTRGGSVRHTWRKAGTYTLTLTEVDTRYQRSVLRLRVTVRPPKAHKN